jgi:type I restriction enzyme, S subunit
MNNLIEIDLNEAIKNRIEKSKWIKLKFSDLVDNIVEKVVPKDSGLEHYIGLEHLESGSLKIRRYGETSSLIGNKLKIYKGDMIFAKRNAYLKRVSIADFDAVASAHSMVLRAKDENVLPEFLPFFLLSEQFWQKAIEISVGSLSPTINWKSIAKQEFFLPPKEEQAKLAKLLWAMNDAVEKKIQLFSKIEILYLSLIEKKMINKSSKKTYFSSLGNVVRGVGFKPNDLLDVYDENCCVILRANNISNNKINYKDIKIISEEKVNNVQFMQENDFGICMSNGSKELVGKAALFARNSKNVSVGSFCAIFRPDNLQAVNILKHLFVSNSYRSSIKRILTGSAINNLKPSDIENLYLRVNFEGSGFDSLISNLNQLSDNKLQIENSIKDSKYLLRSLINQIF